MTTTVRGNTKLFYSPWGLLDFQAEGVAELYFATDEEFSTDGGAYCVYSTGLGKSVVALALSALLYEDDKIDLTIVSAESNKIDEWVADISRFTTLTPLKYHGPNRRKRLSKAEGMMVLVSTYETLKADLVRWEIPPGKKTPKAKDGPLFELLELRGKRILWVSDEVMKLKGRGSETNKAFSYTLKELRTHAHQRHIGLTATPSERDYEDTYNTGRVLVPSLMPTVQGFEQRFTLGKDMRGRYVFRKDRKNEFCALFNGVMVRKSKTDADVVDQFPKQVEETAYVEWDPQHRQLYEAVIDLVDPEELGLTETESAARESALFNLLRLTAGHPAAHLHGQSEWSKRIVDILGEAMLRSIPSSKSIELITRLTPLIKGQGAQVAVFTRYGRTILPEVARDLRAKNFTVTEYHGGMNVDAKEHSKQRFLSGEAEILLLSDAGARGINLRDIQYVNEYESATTFALRVQRINRIHRIDATIPSVTASTQVLRDSVEEGLVRLMLTRNEDHDLLVGGGEGEDFISAADRRAMVREARAKLGR